MTLVKDIGCIVRVEGQVRGTARERGLYRRVIVSGGMGVLIRCLQGQKGPQDAEKKAKKSAQREEVARDSVLMWTQKCLGGKEGLLLGISVEGKANVWREKDEC